MVAQPLRPFVIRLGRIGDMVMLTAALRLLHARYGKPCHVVGADAWAPDVYRGLAEVAECWALPRKGPFFFGFAWPAIVRALRQSAPGPIYVFEHHRRQVPRIRRLLSLGGIDLRRVLHIDTEPGTELLWLDCLMQFSMRTPPALCESDYPVPRIPADWLPRLCVLASERSERSAWLRQRGWRGEPLILVQPGNHRTMGLRRISHWRDRDDKVWPAGRWAELLRRIGHEMPDAMILLRGAAPEVSLLQRIRTEAALPRVVVADTPLRLLFALCECAHSMISVDTGPAHAAAALGLPLVVLYGIQSPRVWLPRSSSGSAVIGLGGPPVASRVDQISVDSVFGAWRSMLPGREGRAAGARQSGDCSSGGRPPAGENSSIQAPSTASTAI